MPQMHWNLIKKKQFNQETGQAMLDDEHSLVSFQQDFGRIFSSSLAGVIAPGSLNEIQQILTFAHREQLSLTIRGSGLSQSGQSLAIDNGVVLSMQHFSRVLDFEGEAIWVEANTTWKTLLETTLPGHLMPYVVPYNCNLSVAGVVSAGGVGSSAFKFGAIVHHIDALEVVLSSGEVTCVDKSSPLFNACLAGQGRVGVISKVRVNLRPNLPMTRTFYFCYDSLDRLLTDYLAIKDTVDYVELFCSPAVMGSQVVNERRQPFAKWLYAMQLTLEYHACPPTGEALHRVCSGTLLHTQDATISSYLLRHEGRFNLMKVTGLWDLAHPWYECFVPLTIAREILPTLLQELPLFYANMVQLAPLYNPGQIGYFMLPKDENICSIMILNPGIHSALLPDCLKVIETLDKQLLALGGKRYLSGFLGAHVNEQYWKSHFDGLFDQWRSSKAHWDSRGGFSSLLYR